MNLAEAKTQLNNDRRRKESKIWEDWTLAKNQGLGTPRLLKKRDDELGIIRQEYEAGLSKVEREILASQSQKVAANDDQITPPETQEQREALQRKSIGTQNLPENKPLSLGQEITKKGSSANELSLEPEIVRRAREENALQANQELLIPEMLQNAANEDSFQNVEMLRAQVEIIDEELALVNTTTNEVLGSGTDEELTQKLREVSKQMKTSFPLAILVVALGKDVVELITPYLELIPVVGQVLWFIVGLFSVLFTLLLWWWMLASSSGAQRTQIKKFVEKRLPVIAATIFGEAIVQFIPATSILVFMIAKEKVNLAKAAKRAVRRIDELEGR